MKKGTKEIWAGVLTLSILLSTPSSMEAAKAAGLKQTGKGQMAVVHRSRQPQVRGEEEPDKETNETTLEVTSETMSTDTSGISPEESLEETSDTISEIFSEDLSEAISSENLSEVITSETILSETLSPEEASENISEIASEYISKTDSESILEETTELENDTKEEWVEVPIMYFSPEISDKGEYDYRTYIDQGADLWIKVKKSEAEQNAYDSIKVKNCSLYDSDFYIELSMDDQIQRYAYSEWLKYLENCRGWVNGKVEVKLSDSGKNYFNSIQMTEQESEAGKGKKTYTIWAEDPDNNVSTKDVENGTRSYITGRDTDAPVLTGLYTDSQYYEPTKTETEQYFAEDFVLKGTFCDEVSGVYRIEYTTDMHAKGDPVWTEAEILQDFEAQEAGNSAVGFQITLSDGCYPAIAVRAYDEAGNVSDVQRFANDAGGQIKVVVDRSAPVLKFDLSAEGKVYHGENDNWTNKDVHIRVTMDQDSCQYAEIYQYEAVYVKIGENMTDVSEKWEELFVQDQSTAEFEVTEDRNGYYCFRAVSKSGVETANIAKQRILIQHEAAELKPVIESGADETKCKDGWYNKQSGTPQICFEYPDYDTGVISKEYDAPMTIHYNLTKKDSVQEPSDAYTADGIEKSALIGVMGCDDVVIHTDGRKEFKLTKDDLKQHIVEFGNEDGFYILEYWLTDKAGNESEKQVYSYKVDCHEPTDLIMELDQSTFDVGKEEVITYERFYRDTVSGSADAQYGISGKGSLEISRVKKIGEWSDMDSLGNMDNITIFPNTRCFLYIRAEDAAGNVAEGWTNGIVVDNMAPNEAASHKELIVEPKGANRHGFFNEDVVIDIRIKDAPENDNCAALETVKSTVGKDGMDTIAGQELFSFTKEAPTEDEIIAAAAYQGTQVVDARANESNEAYIEVVATDRSGNTKTSTQLLKIDVTKPEIDISFDNTSAENGNYYCQERVATVHVHELNFDPDQVSVSVTKDGEIIEAPLSDWTSDGSEHYATLAFAEDGEYRITVSCVDLADNASDEVQSERFVIDRTAPDITIGLTAEREMQTADQDYFNTGVTAVITVTEHNFREEDFVIHMTPVSEKGVWSHEGDSHILRIFFKEDDPYHIDCAYTDLAGNAAQTAERDFVIDTAMPMIIIDGVQDGSANNGAVLPVVSVFDSNIEISDISVSVMTGIGDFTNIAIQTETVSGEGSAGYRLTLTDMTEKADNVYHLTVSARDKAGNEAALTYRFSLNRSGSVYDLISLARLIERQYNTYSELEDIQIIEMNIDTVEEFELYVSRNGALGYEAEYTREMSGSQEIGYTYVYTVAKENFSKEGIYRLTLYSRDRAGNEVNNVADIHGEEISFIVDNTAPKVVIDGVESGMVYNVEAQKVHVAVTDNFKLAEAELTLVNSANEVLESWDYMELAGENKVLEITIPQRSETVSLLYRVKDAAGNEMQTFQGERAALADFLVTTDKYVQFINKPSKTPAGRLIIFIMGAAMLSAISVLFTRIHKRNLTAKDSCTKNTCN